MRRRIAVVLLISVAIPSPAAAETPPRATVADPSRVEARGEITWFRFTPSTGTSRDVTAAALGGAIRVGPRTWITAWIGGAHGNGDVADTARPANAVVGARIVRPLGPVDARIGLEVALPLATVEMRGGVRDEGQGATYAGAATAGGNLDMWRWLAEWMTIAVPARVELQRGGVTLALDGAVAFAFAVGGEYADDRSAQLAQLAVAAERPLGARFLVTGRLGGMALAVGGHTETHGIVELGGAYRYRGGRFDVRLGIPLRDLGVSVTAGTRWSFR